MWSTRSHDQLECAHVIDDVTACRYKQALKGIQNETWLRLHVIINCEVSVEPANMGRR